MIFTNEKKLHCANNLAIVPMTKTIYIIFLAFISAVIYTNKVTAQEKNKWVDFTYVKNANSWLTSENAAGLDKSGIEKMSTIKTFYNRGKGDFLNFYQSDDSYTLGAETESFYRLNKLVFYGKMKYTNFSGKNMGGSTLFNPYFSPFDIVEFADSTAGKKKMETYHLTGAISVPINQKLVLGITAGYTTVGYYKIKDLRHTNDIMNLKTTAGLSYSVDKIATIGANYYFRKRTENTLYQTEGNTDQQFNSLINYGAFFGKQEKFGQDGLTGDDDNNPFVDFIHGVSFQVDLSPANNIHFFNELGIKWRSGYFGKKSSVDVQYTTHQVNTIHYKGKLSFTESEALHHLAFKFKREDWVNFENSYQESTSPGGNTTVLYYGKNVVLDRILSEASLAYTGNLNVINYNPEWVVHAEVSLWRRDQIATIYPFFRIQDIKQLSAIANLKKNIIRNNNMYSIYLGLKYGTGSGKQKVDGSFANASHNYATLNKYLFREYDYLTAERGSGIIAFRYTKAFPEHYRIYAELNYDYTKAFNVTYTGDSFGSLSLEIGYLF